MPQPDNMDHQDMIQQRLEAKLQAVVNTAVDGIITINVHGFIESVNPAAEQMFQYSAHELVGQNIKILMPSPYREQHDEYLEAYHRTGVAKIIGLGREAVGLRKDGTSFPVDLAVSEIKLDDYHGYTGVVRDISQRKKLEKEVLDISTSEQQRIGRDLHDGLGQELTGIALMAGVLATQLESKDLPEAQTASEIVELVNQAIQHTRALVHGLCPVILENDGLMLSLEHLADTVATRYPVKCRFICHLPLQFTDHHVATHLYYIAHEAIHNAVRHGNPQSIDITLEQLADDKARMSISDDGSGISADSRDPDGRGMFIMNYRAGIISGSLKVEHGDKGGTAVQCTFPYKSTPST